MDSKHNIYALLVGIDKYHPSSEVPHLAGCKNDISRIDSFFEERLGEKYHPRVLVDEQATKRNIINGFLEHLTQADADDSIIFYYSGHGSQSMTAREFWRIEPDKLDETIVAYDSRTQNGTDLADKELAHLINHIAKSGAHITIVMDCCHSGSGTREIFGSNVASRRALTDNRPRSQESYFFLTESEEAMKLGAKQKMFGGWISLPKGSHILFSACRSSETAKEKLLDGERRGIFSHYLLETLQSAGSNMTYRDVFMRTNALVRAEVANQSPQLDTSGDTNLNQPFLGGAVQPVPEYYSLEHVSDPESGQPTGWFINGGGANGIKKVGEETTELAFYDINGSADDLFDLDKALGTIKVTAVEPTRSKVEVLPQTPFELDPSTTYRAVITGLPIPPLLVSLEGDEAACKLVRQAISSTDGLNVPSLTVQEASADDADYKVVAADSRFTIGRKQDGYSFVKGAEGYTDSSAQIVVKRLEHIARWENLLKLTNPQSQIDSSHIGITMKKKENNGEFEAVEDHSDISLLSLGPIPGQEAILKLKVKNNSDKPLFFMILAFGEAFEIGSLTEGDEGNGKWLQPGETFTPLSDLGGIPSYIRKEHWAEGIESYRQTIKLIVSTDEGYAQYFVQKELPITAAPVTRKVRQLNDSLSRLMNRSVTRTMGRRDTGKRADWTTVEMSFTIYQPKGENLPTMGGEIKPAPAITIEGHSGLTGQVEIKPLTIATRSISAPKLPHIMRDNPAIFRPLELNPSRSGLPGASVIDLTNLEGAETVTKENPLKITLDTRLQENESLLALGFVDGYVVPLDIVANSHDDHIHVKLTQLPASSVTTRSLKRAVRICFQKYAHRYLGMPYQFPRIASISVSDSGEITYDDNLRDIKAQVETASRIALYIHGFAGDTITMLPSGFKGAEESATPPKKISESHDLILAFDYENINTQIEDVAQQLKEKLAQIGLKAGHDKEVSIIAHSMGGLVARWFIEVLGGNKIVNRLLMCGTPNGGSPLPKYEDWLLWLATIGLNSLAIVAWPISVLNTIITGIEKLDVSLDQMAPDSDLVKNLARNPDPEIPYVIVSGNTSVIPSVIEHDNGFLRKYWARLASADTAYSLVDLAFWQTPNDIAVSVASGKALPIDWETPVTFHEVATDHFGYFRLEDSLRLMKEELK